MKTLSLDELLDEEGYFSDIVAPPYTDDHLAVDTFMEINSNEQYLDTESRETFFGYENSDTLLFDR